MRDSVEAGSDISLQNPLCSVVSTEGNEARFHRICRRATSPKSVGVGISRCFGNWLKGQQVESLHGPISHGGNRKGAPTSVTLGNIYPSERLGMISSLVQGLDGFCLLFRRFPGLPVNAG